MGETSLFSFACGYEPYRSNIFRNLYEEGVFNVSKFNRGKSKACLGVGACVDLGRERFLSMPQTCRSARDQT
jgi:hypothetical protein